VCGCSHLPPTAGAPRPGGVGERSFVLKIDQGNRVHQEDRSPTVVGVVSWQPTRKKGIFPKHRRRSKGGVRIDQPETEAVGKPTKRREKPDYGIRTQAARGKKVFRKEDKRGKELRRGGRRPEIKKDRSFGGNAYFSGDQENQTEALKVLCKFREERDS